MSELGDAVDALTNPYRHVEPIPEWSASRHKRVRRIWITTQPSLLDQLAAAVIPGETFTENDGDATHVAFGSAPPARLDAIDRLLAIEAGAAMWCLRVRLTLRETATGNLRALVGASLDSGTVTQLVRDVTAWHTWAATVTGWQRPAYRPNAPCPVCEHRGALRVRAERQVGCCLACGAAWDASTIGILAEHVKAHLQHSAEVARMARQVARERRMAESA